MRTTRDDIEHHYICGQCKEEVYALATKSLPKTCPYCGWRHKGKEKYSVPSEFRTNINQF